MDVRAVVLRRCALALRIASLSQVVGTAARRLASAAGSEPAPHVEALHDALDDLDAATRESLPWIRASMMPRAGGG
jgi:hypothetical protein